MTKPSLMILDDEPDFCDFVGLVAESIGYEVAIFTDPRLFMDSFAAIDPLVVVLDVIMPEVDGIEVVQWLARQGKRTHVLLVTGYNPYYAKTARMLGEKWGLANVRTLEKPISATELRKALVALHPTVDPSLGQAPEGA